MKTSNQDAFLEGIRVFHQHRRTLEKYYGSGTVRSRRLRRYGSTQSGMEKLLKMVAPAEDTILAYGNGYFGASARKGCQGGPPVCKSVRRYLARFRRVVLIDEFRTSVRSSCCGAVLPWSKGGPRTILCPGCGKEIERDVNAAQNMLAIWTSHLKDGSRPPALCRS